MKLVLVTEAWHPQTNGVVRTLSIVRSELDRMGVSVSVIEPEMFRTIPCPTYPEIRIALTTAGRVGRMIAAERPDFIHIATEGPLGLAARRACLRAGTPFTTSYHTRFPEYVSARYPIPLAWGYAWMRRFHRPSRGVMVATPSMMRELGERGFTNIKAWTRGVDLELFRLREKSFLDLPRPIYLYVGRVSVEKNIHAFLNLKLEGTKLVVGDGPQRAELEKAHPEAVFVGVKKGEELAKHYAASDVFVFPSRTDTFGLVQLEALASGIPVAAFPVPGPIDVIGDSGVGVLDEDLDRAAHAALLIPSVKCREYATRFSWEQCARMFLENLCPITPASGKVASEVKSAEPAIAKIQAGLPSGSGATK